MKKPASIAARAAGACALALSLLSTAQAVPVLEMSAARTATGFDLTVQARDVVDLFAYGISLNFDPALLTVTAGTEGALLRQGGETFFSAGAFDNDAGTISYTLGTVIGLVPGVTGTGSLATFSFSVKQAGLASFQFTEAALLDSTGAEMRVDVRNLVTAVPEPASVAMFAAGLLALLGARRLQARAR